MRGQLLNHQFCHDHISTYMPCLDMDETQDNITALQNSTVEMEFPPWRLVLSLILLGLWLLLALPTTLVTISLLLAVKRSSINKAMGIVHTYVLAVNAIVRVASAVSITIYIPPIIKYCSCSIAASSSAFFFHIGTACYQPYMFASLAVFQLLIIKGKKKFVNSKSVGVTLAVLTVLAALIALLFTIVRITDNDTFLCSGVCPGNLVAHIMIIFATYTQVVWIPSFFTVLIVTTWSCVIFKRHYAGKDAGLNRRIISIPMIVPIIISLTTIITFGIFNFVDRIPDFKMGIFIYNLTLSIKIVVVLLNEMSTGLSYPCLILFLYPQLRASWIALFKSKASCNLLSQQKHNKVTPMGDQHV